MSEIQNYISPANILNIDPKQTVLHSEPVYSDLQDLKRMKCINLIFYKSCTTFYTRIIHIRTIRSFLLLFVFFCYLNLLVIIVSLTHNHSIQLKQLNLIEHIQILANKKYSCYGNISNFYCISHLFESYEY